ncbi:MAG: DUF1861 family protein [Nanoarchaeota archaeon]
MKSKIVPIRNIKGKTAYNPTVPFCDSGKTYIGIRIESLDSELDSRIFFAYKLNENEWEIDDTVTPLQLQDPAYVKVKGEIFILGVRVEKCENGIIWNQDIYRGDSIRNLEFFASGPVGMKDIRLVDLEDRIGVFTRPQEKISGLCKIGYLEISRIDELQRFTENDWYNVNIINGLFEDGSWGGVNQAIKLSDEEIGVIGHKAHKTTTEVDLKKHYYAVSFRFNPKTSVYSDLRILARRADFPYSPSKRSPELDDIIFPGGIDEHSNLYCGLSDYCIGIKEIEHPFNLQI